MKVLLRGSVIFLESLYVVICRSQSTSSRFTETIKTDPNEYTHSQPTVNRLDLTETDLVVSTESRRRVKEKEVGRSNSHNSTVTVYVFCRFPLCVSETSRYTPWLWMWNGTTGFVQVLIRVFVVTCRYVYTYHFLYLCPPYLLIPVKMWDGIGERYLRIWIIDFLRNSPIFPKRSFVSNSVSVSEFLDDKFLSTGSSY